MKYQKSSQKVAVPSTNENVVSIIIPEHKKYAVRVFQFIWSTFWKFDWTFICQMKKREIKNWKNCKILDSKKIVEI
jgi:hypothetical protein